MCGTYIDSKNERIETRVGTKDKMNECLHTELLIVCLAIQNGNFLNAVI